MVAIHAISPDIGLLRNEVPGLQHNYRNVNLGLINSTAYLELEHLLRLIGLTIRSKGIFN